MTIYDISEKAGVSIATVSRVINGNSNVSEATKQKVLRVMNKYGYTPNAFARGLGLNTMKTIGIMCADSSDLYLAKAIYFIERNLRSHGYNTLLCCSGYEHENKINSLDLLLSKKVDGVILVGSSYVSEVEKDNKYIVNAAKKIPIMLLNAALDTENVYSVLPDNVRSTYNATVQMIEDGAKDILYFYNSTTYSGNHKLQGYQKAMSEKCPSIKEPAKLFFQGSHEDIPKMAEKLCEYADEGHTFDAIVAADDYLALGALKYAIMRGISVPEDLMIIGHNNCMLTTCCFPELSSIDDGLEKLCAQLTTTLMSVLSGNQVRQKTLFAGEIINRGTTKK